MSTPPSPPGETVSFKDLNLHEAVLKALSDVGYENPSPIQAATIPRLLEGRDVLGQAQTGTGKTAAFALPLLSQIDISQRVPQALVLVPTRELAIQVAEAFQKYAAHLQGFHVVPIYGGQSYVPQLKSLRRGVHVIVGTPGRVMDHIQRETMKLDTLKYLVLDEADEMLRMGFIDAVEWVLEQLPEERQIALFSATMPPEVRRIAQKHLNEPAEVTIKSKTSTAANIRQRYWIVGGLHKLDALTRILEVEPFDGMLVFTRTKLTTSELAEKLEARGFAVEALHGDIAQAQRERTVARLKAGQIDIVVATDVAARGLDVERISHVINYDVPHDPESYIHRIGRTGRAGRSGEAILFIAPRERNMLRVIERATRQSVTQMELPTTADVNEQRVKRFNERIQAVITAGEAEPYRAIIERFEAENTTSAVEIAAALAFIAQGKKPLLLDATDTHKSSHGSRHESKTDQAWGTESSSKHKSRKERREGRGPSGEPGYSNGRSDFKPRDDERPVARDNRIAQDNTDFDSNARVHGHLGSDDGERGDSGSHVASLPPFGDSGSGAASPPPFGDSKRNSAARSDDNGRDSDGARYMGGRDSEVMETYRVEVGREHGVAPSNILGAIANEAELPGKRIGRIVIREDHSFVDLPTGMPKEVFLKLQKVVVSGQKLRISRALKAHVQQLRGGDRYQKGKKSARY